MLDTLETSPSYVKTAAGDLLAWNRAASVVFTDYGQLAPKKRNLMLLLFCDSQVRSKMPNWEQDARFTVANFRLEATRVGAGGRVAEVVTELCRDSLEFRAMWAGTDVSDYGEGTKHIIHPSAGPLSLEFSAFAVDGRPDLGLVIYTPATPEDIGRVRGLVTNVTRLVTP